MTPEAQQIAIAGACGWKLRWQISGGGILQEDKPNSHCWEVYTAPTEWFETKKGKNYLHDPYNCDQIPPDYLNDLNAMHEAEKILAKKHKRKYLDILGDDEDQTTDVYLVYADCVFATAAQRAEAFLKTLNLWK